MGNPEGNPGKATLADSPDCDAETANSVACHPTPKQASPSLHLEDHDAGIAVAVDDRTPDGTAALMQAVGSEHGALIEAVMSQIAARHIKGGSMAVPNAILALLYDAEPSDGLETQLIIQMAEIHSHFMGASRRFAEAEYADQLDMAERQMNRLAKTYAAQIEALKRHRSGGEQKVTVEHVTVNSGGQAIVGSVDRGPSKKGGST